MSVPKLPHPPHNMNISHIAISVSEPAPLPDINIPNVCPQPPGFNIPNLWLKPLPWHHNINIPYYLYLSITPPPHTDPPSINIPNLWPKPPYPSNINISNDFPKTPPNLSLNLRTLSQSPHGTSPQILTISIPQPLLIILYFCVPLHTIKNILNFG